MLEARRCVARIILLISYHCKILIPQVASSRTILDKYGITNIVNCCSMVVDDYFLYDKNMNYLRLNLLDGGKDDITWFTADVINFVETARLTGKRTLIHCEKGISRSCSFAIAYIIWASGRFINRSLLIITHFLHMDLTCRRILERSF